MVTDQNHSLSRRSTRSCGLATLALLINYHIITASSLAVGLVFHTVGLGLDLVCGSSLLVLQILTEGEVGLIIPVIDANAIFGELIPAHTIRDSLSSGLDGTRGRKGGKINVDGTPGQITEG